MAWDYFLKGIAGERNAIFPECTAKGSHLGLEVWRLESCSLSVVLVFATIRNRSQRDRDEDAKPCLWAALKKCLQDDVHDVDCLAKSGGSLARNARFGAQGSQTGRSCLRFVWQAQYFRSLLCHCSRFVFSWQACIVPLYCAISWQAQHFMTCQRCSFDESQSQAARTRYSVKSRSKDSTL